MKKRNFVLTKPSQLRAKKLLILATLFFCSIGFVKAQDPPDWTNIVNDHPIWFDSQVTLSYIGTTSVISVQDGKIRLGNLLGPCNYQATNGGTEEIYIYYYDQFGRAISKQGIKPSKLYVNGLVDNYINIPVCSNGILCSTYQIIAYSPCKDIGSWSNPYYPWGNCCRRADDHNTSENCPPLPDRFMRRMKWIFDPQDIQFATPGSGQTMVQVSSYFECECCDKSPNDLTGGVPNQRHKGDSK